MYKCQVWFTSWTLILTCYSGNNSSLVLWLHRENIFLLQAGHTLTLMTLLTAWRCGQLMQMAQKPLQKAINENNLQCVFPGESRTWAAATCTREGASNEAHGTPYTRASAHWKAQIHSLTRPGVILSGYSILMRGCQYFLNCVGLVCPPETPKRCWLPDGKIQSSCIIDISDVKFGLESYTSISHTKKRIYFL